MSNGTLSIQIKRKIFLFTLPTLLLAGSILFCKFTSDMEKEFHDLTKLYSSQIKEMIEYSSSKENFFDIKNRINSLVHPNFLQGMTLIIDSNEVYHFKSQSHCNSNIAYDYNIKFHDNSLKERFGKLYLTLGKCHIKEKKINIFILFSILFFTTIGILTFLGQSINKTISSLLNKIVHLVKRDSSNNLPAISKELTSVINEIHNVIEKQTHQKTADKLNEFSTQIRHDLRSPLEALRYTMAQSQNINENTKEIILSSISRISEIASNLQNPSFRPTDNSYELINLKVLLEDFINNKGLGLEAKIELHSHLDYRESFVLCLENDFYKIISSITESKKNTHKITIDLGEKDQNIEVLISIFKQGKNINNISHNNKHDFLDVAKNILKKYNGSLIIETTLPNQLAVIVKFPSEKSPKCFIEEITINKKNVVCIDDDQSFLLLYKSKFSSQELNLSFSSSFPTSTNLDTLYLCDYDLRSSKTGLQFIIENNICSNSILITSMYQLPSIQKSCNQHGIKLLPKQIFNSSKVHIQLQKEDKRQIQEEKKYVLIDDDPLIRKVWEIEAKKKNVLLHTFSSRKDLLQQLNLFNTNDIFYIDCNLSNNEKGEDLAKELFDMNFTQLYLATGYDPKNFSHLSFIKGVIGKRPPKNL